MPGALFKPGDFLELSMLKKALVLVASAATAVGAFAQTTAIDYSATITPLKDAQSSYSTVMIGLAVAAVSIMIGIKWVKRARGAA